MTDTSETQTKAPSEGDTLTIKRGKFGGQTGTVLGDSGDGRTVVKLESGIVTMVQPENLKAPAEQTFTVSMLEAALRDVGAHRGGHVETDSFLRQLATIGIKVELPYQA